MGVRRLWIRASSAEQHRLAIRSRLVIMVVLVAVGWRGMERGMERGRGREAEAEAEARAVEREEEEEAEGLMTRRWIRDEVEEDGSGGRTKADVVAMRMARRRKRGGGWRRSCGRGGGGARGAFITAALPPDRYTHRRTSLPRLG